MDSDHFLDDLNQFQFKPENYLMYHVMLLTSSDRFILESDLKRELEDNLRDALDSRGDCRIVDYLVMPDHLHLILLIPPIHSVQEVVRDIQERTWPCLQSVVDDRWENHVLWSPTYCASVLKDDENIKLREWHDNSIQTECAPRFLDHERCYLSPWKGKRI